MELAIGVVFISLKGDPHRRVLSCGFDRVDPVAFSEVQINLRYRKKANVIETDALIEVA